MKCTGCGGPADVVFTIAALRALSGIGHDFLQRHPSSDESVDCGFCIECAERSIALSTFVVPKPKGAPS